MSDDGRSCGVRKNGLRVKDGQVIGGAPQAEREKTGAVRLNGEKANEHKSDLKKAAGKREVLMKGV